MSLSERHKHPKKQKQNQELPKKKKNINPKSKKAIIYIVYQNKWNFKKIKQTWTV